MIFSHYAWCAAPINYCLCNMNMTTICRSRHHEVTLAMSQGGEVLEGFLCPLCMKDLGDVIQLQVRRWMKNIKEMQNLKLLCIISPTWVQNFIKTQFNVFLSQSFELCYFASGNGNWLTWHMRICRVSLTLIMIISSCSDTFWWSTFQRRPSICPVPEGAVRQSQADPRWWGQQQ